MLSLLHVPSFKGQMSSVLMPNMLENQIMVTHARTSASLLPPLSK